jgi:multisubunit Na+/H+ antiporter MnhE subunit
VASNANSAASWLKAVCTLLAHFFVQLVLSGLVTAWLIVRRGNIQTSGLARIPFEGLNETGAAVLGCLLTLTPGTTALDIDMQGHTLLIHFLDATHREKTASEIRRRFEIPLRRLFPGGREQ